MDESKMLASEDVSGAMEQVSQAITHIAAVAERAGGGGNSSRSAAPPAMGYYKINGEWLPKRVSTRCFVCGAERFRWSIDHQIASGISPVAIAESLPEKVATWHGKEVTLTPRHISRHAERHLPLEIAVKVRALEAAARSQGMNPEEYNGSLATHIGYNDLVLQTAMEGLLRGELRPSIAEGLQAVKNKILLDQMGDDSIEQERIATLMQMLGECINELAYAIEDGRLGHTHQDILYGFGTLVKNKPGLLALMQPPTPATSVEDDEG